MGTEQQVVGINKNNIVLYTIKDGSVRAPFIFQDETFWTTQRVMAELFSVNVPAISKHIENIFSEGELLRDSTVSKKEIVQQEGGRTVQREVDFYSLDAIIAVGYRVNSEKATLFRQWATETLRNYVIRNLSESKTFRDLTEDQKRIAVRREMAEHNKSLAEAAKMAGIIDPKDYAIFQDEGYKGLYGGLNQKQIHERKGLKKSHKILDFMGSTELAANLFRATQTDEKIRKEGIAGKVEANKTHHEVGKSTANNKRTWRHNARKFTHTGNEYQTNRATATKDFRI